MKKIATGLLTPRARLEGPVYTVQGRPLVAACQCLTQLQIRAMLEAGIEEVLVAGADQPEGLFQHTRRAVDVDELEVGYPVAEDIYDRADHLLVGAGQKLTDDTLAVLHGIRPQGLCVHRNPGCAEYSRFLERTVQRSVDTLNLLLASNPEQLRVTRPRIPSGRGLGTWQGVRRDPRRIEKMRKWYDDLLELFDRSMQKLRRGQLLLRADLDGMLDALFELLCYDKDLALHFPNLELKCPALVKHSVDVCLLATVTGLFLDYPGSVVRDLAEAALLHDLGMLGVPETILASPGKLSEAERKRIYQHPRLGLQVLLRVETASHNAALVVYQSHEREGGQGYPANRSGEQVHDFARLLALADTYQALIQPRPHRPKQHPCTAVQTMSKMVKIGLLNRSYFRAFCQAVGFYPIGSVVVLPGGETARVVSSNQREIYAPQIAVIKDPNGNDLPESAPRALSPQDAGRMMPCPVELAAELAPLSGF